MSGRPPRHAAAADTPQPSSLRVISGTLRGRKFTYNGDVRTRPMKERVRESVFDLLGTTVKGTWAIDLFAGTGALGIEALSRGATHATFIEQFIPTAKILRENLRELDLSARADVHAGDTFIWLRRFAPRESAGKWLVFCAPPYEFYVSRVDELLAGLEQLITLAPAGSHFVIECDERFDVARLPQATAWDVRRYPPAVIGIYEKPAG